MRVVYSLLMYLLTPFLLLRLWWKGRHLPAYRQRIAERFGFGKANSIGRVDVWVHAVSLGEVIAATPLIDAMLEKNWKILITNMTPTGSERVRTRFGEKVFTCYVPYDLPWVLKRFYARIRPKVGIIMETELWPNLIHYAQEAKIPLLLANARLSERSLTGYMRFQRFFTRGLNQFTAILAQSEEDAARFERLGAKKQMVHVLGNMKFDLQTHAVDKAQFDALKRYWGNQRTVLIAASTHDDEESQLLNALSTLQRAIPEVILLIAPRHPERFQPVYQLCQQRGFNTGLRSKTNTLSPQNEVVVLDCLGELLGLFHISDYAFIGGSLVAVGGHNVLEPIAMQVPVFSGHHVHNFKTICCDLEQAKAIQLVDNAEQLVEMISQLHVDPALKQRQVANATAVLENNKGSVMKHLDRIVMEM